MISRRENFHRVYDLRERVLANALPGWEDALAPNEQEVRRALALKAVRALGVAVARWVPDYFRTPKKGVAGLLEELADEGSLLRATIEDLDEPAYVHPDNAELAEEVLSGGLRSSVTTLLSPFDPVVWDRARALELFGFEYKIEVYTPAARRRYGYYSLPILHRRRPGRQARREGPPQAGSYSRSEAAPRARCAGERRSPRRARRRAARLRGLARHAGDRGSEVGSGRARRAARRRDRGIFFARACALIVRRRTSPTPGASVRSNRKPAQSQHFGHTLVSTCQHDEVIALAVNASPSKPP